MADTVNFTGVVDRNLLKRAKIFAARTLQQRIGMSPKEWIDHNEQNK